MAKKKETKQEKNTETESVKTTVDSKDFRWYILRSNSGKEKSIAEQLRQRIRANNLEDVITEVIVPIQEKIVIKRGKKQTVEERIFPGYILVKMKVNDDAIHIIINTEGVLGFIGSSSTSKRPTPISEKEVEGIMAFMKIKQMPTYQAKFSQKDAVKVVDGPFKDFVGTVQEVNESKGQVTVLLTIFGRETPVQLDFLQVNKI